MNNNDEAAKRFLRESNMLLEQFKRMQMDTLKTLKTNTLSSGSIGGNEKPVNPLVERQLAALANKTKAEDESLYCKCDDEDNHALDANISGNERVLHEDGEFCTCEHPVPMIPKQQQINAKLKNSSIKSTDNIVPAMYKDFITIKERKASSSSN
jgi:hypothetical protein